MNAGLDELTDKEKEALRLLLSGHDAKSSAAELGLSVHTVNDRLRSARRKLSVSSSREAARILGEAEGTSPQMNAHTPFGIAAEQGVLDNAGITNTKRAGPFGLTWLAGGMLIMSIVIAAAIIAVVSTEPNRDNSVDLAAQDTPELKAGAENPESLARAERFLIYVDGNDWRGAWQAAGTMMRTEISASQWEAQIKPVREHLGAVEERRLSNVQRVGSSPGGSNVAHEVLQFQTKFENSDELALETVVMIEGENGWEVINYFIV